MAKYIIIGGVAGGATTAARLRRVDENAEIVLFEKGEHISYANCGLPYYIGGVIEERQKLLVQTPESFNARFNIDIRIHSEVVGIDSQNKTVTVQDSINNRSYTEKYDKLVLSPGASPLRPPIPGIDDENIFTLRNVNDTDKIKGFIDNDMPQRAVVIGAGFVGVEMAENLHHKGITTTVVEAQNQILAPLDIEIASTIHQHFKDEGVGLVLSDPVSEFVRTSEGLQVKLKSGRTLEADLVILSLGVRPDTRLAKQAGLKLGERGGILVDEYLQTSAKDIYALGDAIEFPNPITGEMGLSLLAGPANKQGRLLADNLVFGNSRKWKGSIGTAIAKVFKLTTASSGVNEKTLKRLNIPHFSTLISAGSHAGYYPGAKPMSIKITFSPDGKLFGIQAVGTRGVDKRIDMAASVIRYGGTIYDLQELEHAYAPPFSSAKDPINQIGFNAENILRGFFKPLTVSEVDNRDLNDTYLLDVRSKDEFNNKSIKGAVNIPVNDIRDNIDLVPKGKKIFLYCGTGLRSYVASRVLAQKGYEVYNLSGGINLYNNMTAEQDNFIDFSKSQKLIINN